MPKFEHDSMNNMRPRPKILIQCGVAADYLSNYLFCMYDSQGLPTANKVDELFLTFLASWGRHFEAESSSKDKVLSSCIQYKIVIWDTIYYIILYNIICK